MANMLIYLALAPLALFAAVRCYHLARNYMAARKFGLPIIPLPVSFEDAWWVPLRPLFSWVERLPFGLGSWYVYTEMGWPTVDGNRTVSRLGENFILCSPQSNVIVTCYPPGIDRILKNHKNWPQPGAQSQLFAFYGQNVSSTNGAEWQRHRKITASAFNEHSMHQVWNESIKRATDLDLAGENARTLCRIRSTFDVLAMEVLAVVGFGQDTALTTVPPGHRESLMQSLGFILRHVLLTVIFNGLKAPDFLLPGVLRRLKVSVAEFRLYMEELILRQMQLSRKEKSQSRATSLLEAMVNANEAEKQPLQTPTARPSYLTESELYGNLFVFNLAGFETTASTMTFALAFLAAHPDVQEWLVEEVDRYYSTSRDRNYAAIYPQLVRCLAFMYETLRLASPAPLLVRSPIVSDELPIATSSDSTMLTVNPGTFVGIHSYGAHLSPRWGVDAQKFNPKRFVSTSEAGGENVVVPETAAYLPWMFGPRVCPGKKFSQVEFVAIIAQTLSGYRVEVLRSDGESDDTARARLMRALDDKYFNVSAHLKRPEVAGVQFVQRNT
ncbi:putative cytochrome P450 [Zopfia rhizophila CBS 207.26]|uniref:Putative cytochrome P450 n=1 Tax=Zopfia rhizophila CBS 207.26 TaxID=1314779 RepID=A0A6A6EA04_9PEZI|nr:putative cytochrome P450 [Zopfia rhizophila CBS 207.26]